MTFAEIAQLLTSQFSKAVVGQEPEAVDPWLIIAPGELLSVCHFLRDDPRLAFNYLNCVTGVDYLPPDKKQRRGTKAEWESHLEVVYHLSSVGKGHRLVLKVHLPRWKDDQPGQLPEVPSVAAIWPTADWHEREVYDLVGVHFSGHPDLRRILCPDDWVGHPLRKDYEMPAWYHGIRGK